MLASNKILPKISIVTPSFNQGQFIEETILSVIGQGYPNLEFIIIDGGSTDNTVEIIKKYEKNIDYWISEKDNGQSHAINKGFARATGDIFAWLNSDDMYMPGALAYIAQRVRTQSMGIYFGDCLHFKESESGVQSWGSTVAHMHAYAKLENVDYIIQPSSFWTKEVWQSVGTLREDMYYAFDWEWFLRAKYKGIALHGLGKTLSMYRIHDEHKSGMGGNQRQDKIYDIYKVYAPNYALLYKKVRKSIASPKSLAEKALSYIVRKTHNVKSEAEIIKILQATDYKGYSIEEINQSISML